MADYQQFIVIRHGESQTNATNTFQAGNQYDLDPLTPFGSEDASRLAERLSALPVNLIISSSYLRARSTAGAIAQATGAPHIVPVWEGSSWVDLPADDPDLAIHPSLLREIDLPSELQGLAFHVPQAREIQHATMAVADKPDGRFSDEENLYDLWRRAEEIRRYLEARPERLTVVVAHGGRHRLLAVRPSRYSKEYWTANKAVFENEVKEPMAALVESLPERFGPFKIFRMNRDIRFSHDKSPYKTQHGAAHEADGTVHYVHLDARGLMAACGAYMMAPDQLERYREAVAADSTGRALEGILDELSKRGFEVGHGMTEPLRTAPRGYPRDHPRVDLLRQRAVSAHRRLEGSELRDAAAVRRFVVDTFDACGPMNDWIKSNIGSSRTSTVRR